MTARGSSLLYVGAAGGLGVLFWESPVLLPLKLLTVLFHELGHALSVLAMGGEVQGISVNFLQGGLTRFTLPDALLPRIIVASSGYLGSALFGALLLFLYGRPRRFLGARRVTALLGLLLLGILIFSVRDLGSLVITAPLSATLLLAARFLPDRFMRPGGIALASFVSLYALFDLRSDLLRLPWEMAPTGTSDAMALAELTHLPALLWALAWTALALLILGLTLRWMARAPRLDSSPRDR